ncbi:YceD family protein [Caldalkalibacillus mannanilyticus]|uniref:YceD family protein n=1 Tax=Caldalkalibacillus mannanilyticus TaxID=1418 RepID=UPI00046A64C0|nr:YceD family protein [Caldalkalibacillus mannanilyticus]
MIINVKQCLELKGKELPLKHTYELAQLTQRNKQLLSVSPIQFEGQGQMQSGVFVIKGTLQGTCIVACSRCLGDVNLSILQELEERFNIQAKLGTIEENEEQEIHEVIGQEINLTPYVENEVLLSIPSFPVCRSEEECKNHLPQEGKDWNVLTEKMKQDKIDPRLADLAKFFDQNK